MWHILRAKEGAEIALDSANRSRRERLRQAAVSGEIEKLLRWIPVQPGETYFTPAGTVHAIGGGLALCEIQQVSDVTYRLYDYGRPRELHLDKAAEVSDLGLHPGPAVTGPWVRGTRLWRAVRISRRRLSISGGASRITTTDRTCWY